MVFKNRHRILSATKLIAVLAALWAIFGENPGLAETAAPPNNPVEVGHVNWSRDYQGALHTSRETGKPIFLLFQEVPGCIGCQNFGQQVLTHPLLVEAIEEEFIPVLVYNNRHTGKDRELLKRFDEPSWNYQVIRFIDADQRDIIPRRDRVWDLGGVATRMAAALEAAERPVPTYLKALSIEHDSEQLETAVFGMFCFWTGEYELGSIDGVVTTEAGFYHGREVTLVRYHQKQIGLEQLIEEAAARQCAESVYIENSGAAPQSRLQVKQFDHDRYRRAPSSDQKKQLQRWLADHQELQLTPQQLTKLNALMAGDREVALSWLSPRQRAHIEP